MPNIHHTLADATSPLGKIQSFSKLAVTLEPVMQGGGWKGQNKYIGQDCLKRGAEPGFQ